MTNGQMAQVGQMLSRRRVLVVEDNDNARRLYADALQRANFLVDEARNLDEAISHLNAREYHVALVDIMLSEEPNTENRDGLRVLNAVKEARAKDRPGWQTIRSGTRSIALTAQEEPELAAEIRTEFGADDYIDKRRYIGKLTEEIVNRVKKQAGQFEASPYGDFRIAIQFMAGERDEPLWVDKSLRMLKAKGYGELARFLSALCDPIAPLIPETTAKAPTVLNEDLQIISGRLWSKALAMPVSLLIGRKDVIESLLAAKKQTEWSLDHLLIAHDTEELSGRIFELKGVPRSAFQSSVVFQRTPLGDYL